MYRPLPSISRESPSTSAPGHAPTLALVRMSQIWTDLSIEALTITLASRVEHLTEVIRLE